jgi:hypothetical protein
MFMKVSSFEIDTRSCFYAVVPGIGAMYAQWQSPKPGAKFFQVDHDDGETFVWIGRLHCIVTPWKRARVDLVT